MLCSTISSVYRTPNPALSVRRRSLAGGFRARRLAPVAISRRAPLCGRKARDRSVVDRSPPPSGEPAGAARTCGWAREGEGPSRPCGAYRGIPQPPYGGGGRQPEQPVDAVELLLLEGASPPNPEPMLVGLGGRWSSGRPLMAHPFQDASGKQLPQRKQWSCTGPDTFVCGRRW